jgi:hypothetical protein
VLLAARIVTSFMENGEVVTRLRIMRSRTRSSIGMLWAGIDSFSAPVM